MVSSVSRRLVEIFFATTALKKENGTKDPSLKPRAVTKLGLLGGGLGFALGFGLASIALPRPGAARK